MRLSHLHLPGPISYTHSLQLQEALLNKQFAYKTYIRKSTPASATSSPPPPNPTLLTFQTHPTYTVGRRHLKINPLSPAQIAYLTTNADNPPSSENVQQATTTKHQLATFYPSPRGGLLTYHAPGQITAYLILNLRTHNLTPRCYIRALENTVIRTCARHGVPNTATTEDPGVWVTDRPNLQVINVLPQVEGQTCQTVPETGKRPEQREGEATGQPLQPTDRKICAVGVQVSRGITSHGIGLNVFDSPITSGGISEEIPASLYTLPEASGAAAGAEADSVYTRTTTQLDHYIAQQPQTSRLAPGYLSWGFSRIVACGLQGKSVTWLSREQQSSHSDKQPSSMIDAVSQSLAVEVCRSLGLDERDIESLEEGEVLAE